MAQIRDLNRGTFGFVQLALDTQTGTQVAIKFIERGEKVLRFRSYQPNINPLVEWQNVSRLVLVDLSDRRVLQIDKYVEHEILNHKRLNQPHIIELREVCHSLMHVLA